MSLRDHLLQTKTLHKTHLRCEQLRLGDDRTPGLADQGTVYEVEAVVEQREDNGENVIVERVNRRRSCDSSDGRLLVAVARVMRSIPAWRGFNL